MNKHEDIINKKFGSLTAIKFHHMYKKKQYWLFKCDCGKEKIICLNSVLLCKTKSCGCYRSKKQFLKMYKHGYGKKRINCIYRAMKKRCYNDRCDRYEYYGARGIKICDEWLKKPISFYEWAMNNGYRDDLTIDRIDVNSNYCPENCRWVSQKEQTRNTRKNVLKEYKGKKMCIAGWADYFGKTYSAFYSYVMRHGFENAVSFYGDK